MTRTATRRGPLDPATAGRVELRRWAPPPVGSAVIERSWTPHFDVTAPEIQPLPAHGRARWAAELSPAALDSPACRRPARGKLIAVCLAGHSPSSISSAPDLSIDTMAATRRGSSREWSVSSSGPRTVPDHDDPEQADPRAGDVPPVGADLSISTRRPIGGGTSGAGSTCADVRGPGVRSGRVPHQPTPA